MRKLCSILAAAALFMSAAGSSAAPLDRHTLFAVLRPDANGKWYIQDDSSHKRYGIDTYIEQTDTYIRIFTCCVASYRYAGNIQISSDDDFSTRVEGHSNLGTNNATIRIFVDGQMIKPADIWQAMGGNPGGGNLWVTLQMVE